MAHQKPHQKLIKEGEGALKDPDIKPEEVEEWWRKKGMDKSEAKDAINSWKHSKGAEEWDRMQKAAGDKKDAPQAATKQTAAKSPKKWGFWFVIFIAVLIIISVVLYKMGLIRI
ncbi:MAG: hypothetical protein HYV01_15670 [Deltaproteobacteria bacterium]|nr:hypothetical protein [Deltaproteobacteria bacterium]